MRTDDEIVHRKFIALRFRVLEVCQRIDPDGVGYAPGLVGEPLDDRQGLAREDVAVLGPKDEEDVVGLGVGILQRLIGDQLRVLLAEEHPEIGGESQIPYAGGGGGGGQQTCDEDRPTPADHPTGVRRN